METEPPSTLLQLLTIDASTITGVVFIVVLIALLLLSALISGSEVAFFSLGAGELEELEDESTKHNHIRELLSQPEELLGTILISNNFVNVGIVILSTYLLNTFFSPELWSPLLTFIIEILAITGVLLLFGEILPKVYANTARLNFARSVVPFIFRLHKILKPLSKRLSKTINRINIEGRGPSLSVDDLEQALELTNDEHSTEDEQRILKGIVRFGSTTVKEVMTPRTSVIAIDIKAPFHDTLAHIVDKGYSRIPVYEDQLDQIKGLLYVKDLLPYVDASDNFGWQDLIRTPFFVPESKKIDDLLKEFQQRRIHLAIVVDEFGGTSGVISLEDVIEEIVGEISDEFDDDDLVYSKLDDHNYVFEAQTPLIDFCRVLDLPKDIFESVDGESDSLAGLVLELAGKFLEKNEEITYEAFTFKVESVDQRKLIRIKVTVNPNHEA
ncbi:gliding motility-associated protein GldE [Schleiferiaceae bacterium]|nr:gliding motility-associated protein GldE [Flavobacteriales bacterium]MDA8577175.1 gliding motility-associated protein GldE [Schleiferiaceae bacterium]PTM17742.1 MAG: hemolysin [Bacteroidota bacterium]MDA8582457.1 gliding motility-associated protein GldE [Schleiferiaceae bacterium]MDB2627569.1 gliding motility-associated protein GldE [Schleiferiaceae bacterium]